MTSRACVVVACGRRADLVDSLILPSLRHQGFDEVVVVGTHHDGASYRYLHVPSVTGTTVDALIKRDVGAVATSSDVLVYLADDHRLDPDFWHDLEQYCRNRDEWDVLAPSRYTIRDGQRYPLNMGKADGYIGGHGVVIQRRALRLLPWMAGQHSLVWDVAHTQEIGRRGARVIHAPDGTLAIEDVEPGATPWR